MGHVKFGLRANSCLMRKNTSTNGTCVIEKKLLKEVDYGGKIILNGHESMHGSIRRSIDGNILKKARKQRDAHTIGIRKKITLGLWNGIILITKRLNN